MNFKSFLFLGLIAGVAAPAAYAQNAGFAVGIQRPMNPPVAPVTRPPVQGRIPHFGVTPHNVPRRPLPNIPTFVGPHRGGPGGPGTTAGPGRPGGPGYGNRGYGGAYGGSYGAPYGGGYGNSYGSPFGDVYGPTIVVPNGNVVTNSTVIIQQQPAGQVVRVGPPTQPVTVTGNEVNYQNSLVGMTRDQVIQQFGNPISGVYSQSGELLAFPGGMTVTIQNGKVVGPN